MYVILNEYSTGAELVNEYIHILKLNYDKNNLIRGLVNPKTFEELFKKLVDSKDNLISKLSKGFIGLPDQRKKTYFELAKDLLAKSLNDLDAYRKKHLKTGRVKEQLIIQSENYLYEVNILSISENKVAIEIVDRMHEDLNIFNKLVLENTLKEHMFEIYIQGENSFIPFTKSKIWKKV